MGGAWNAERSIFYSTLAMRLYCRYSAVSGTTTDASLSLMVTVHTLHLHRTAEKTFVVIKSAATMNAFINIEKQQLHPLNCLIRLVIQYRSSPAPVPVPVPFPTPCFSSCPNHVESKPCHAVNADCALQHKWPSSPYSKIIATLIWKVHTNIAPRPALKSAMSTLISWTNIHCV